MNIFYLDIDPYIAALYHGDKHVSKMLIETAQMLSTAHHVLSGEVDINNKPFSHNLNARGFYKPTHVNHPSTQWVRECSGNYEWAFKLYEGLCGEFYLRRHKIHATQTLYPLLCKAPINMDQSEMTDPPLAMPDKFKTSDAVYSYRQYYQSKFRDGIVSYNWSDKRKLPFWLTRSSHG